MLVTRHHQTRAPFEAVRLGIVRTVYLALCSLMLLALRLAPKEHPGRMFLNGAIRENRQRVPEALIAPPTRRQYVCAIWQKIALFGLVWALLNGIVFDGEAGPGDLVAWALAQ